MKRLTLITMLCATGMALPPVGFAQTSSPFPPPEEKLGTYVINSGPGLDTGCTFRGGGPLVIKLHVPATMNPKELDSNGYIKDVGKLVSNNVISRTAKISFPIYDVDDKASGTGYAPEIDDIYFNGERIKSLSGFNNTWVNDSFVIDIGKVKFNTENEIRVDIDVANAGSGEYWCMAVDWVAIEFESAVPYVLAHGISADASSWDEADAPGALQEMDDRGVLYTRFSTGKNDSVAANAIDLKGKIKGFLDTVKAKKVHIIAHSKGGLDSQALAKLSKPDFEVLSLSTLSTPHLGSVVADLQLIQRQWATLYVNNGSDPHGYAQQYVTRSLAGLASGLGAGPQPPGLNDLTTGAARAAILAGIRGNVANTFTIGADAGPRCTRAPTDEEIDPMAPWYGGSYLKNTLRLSYQTICDFSMAVDLGTTTTVYPSYSGYPVVITTLTYRTVQAPQPQPNDIVVSETSANPYWGVSLGNNADTNHSEVKNGNNIRNILDRTIKMR